MARPFHLPTNDDPKSDGRATSAGRGIRVGHLLVVPKDEDLAVPRVHAVERLLQPELPFGTHRRLARAGADHHARIKLFCTPQLTEFVVSEADPNGGSRVTASDRSRLI